MTDDELIKAHIKQLSAAAYLSDTFRLPELMREAAVRLANLQRERDVNRGAELAAWETVKQLRAELAERDTTLAQVRAELDSKSAEGWWVVEKSIRQILDGADEGDR